MNKRKKILVTGANGMIGRQLVRLLKERGARVFDTDLPVDLAEYIKASQDLFAELALQFDEVKETLGIDFIEEGERSTSYFPLNREIINQEEQKQIENVHDLVIKLYKYPVGALPAAKFDTPFVISNDFFSLI